MEDLSRPVIFVLSEGGREVAERLSCQITGAQIHGLSGRVTKADVFFDQAALHLQNLFQERREIIGVCAAAILIRVLGPLQSDKWTEPPVLAVSEDGRTVVPLLGGHRGANRRARECAAYLDAYPAITTASDVHFDMALDDPPSGYILANPKAAKDFTARLLTGEPVRIEGRLDWLRASSLSESDEAQLCVRETILREEPPDDALLYISRRVVVGVGCERGCEADEIFGLVERSLNQLEIDPQAVGLIVSIDLKADEPSLHELSERLDCPLRFFDAGTLEREASRLSNPSEVVFAEIGCHGVAEGAVLAALGAEGTLALEKRKSRRATCAVGIREEGPWREPLPGKPQGELFVVGLGPGRADWRTPEAERLIRASTDLVGYKLYLDLLGPLTHGKTLHVYQLGEEEKRVRAALNLAKEGRRVALISSGDPGIYAMASLVYELLETTNQPEWHRIHIQVSPGVSAMQAAAAKVGAPLGHDFCAISLSDLMTPWEVIQKRIAAAAEGDFTIAFYNPASQRRDTQLTRAKEILLRHRTADTPVIVARNVGREDEQIRIVRLSELNADSVDMLTLVIVGSSETRTHRNSSSSPWVYTPRGYGEKKKNHSNEESQSA